MNEIKEIIQILNQRLFEVQTRLNQLSCRINTKNFSSHLFTNQGVLSNEACLNEIRLALKALEQSNISQQQAHYLSDKVNKQINALIHFCQFHQNQARTLLGREKKIQIEPIQTWIQQKAKLKQDIESAEDKIKVLETMIQDNQVEGSARLLALNAELGQLHEHKTKLIEKLHTH